VPGPADAANPKQAAYDALNALLAKSDAAAKNPDNTKAAQDTAFAVRTATAEQLNALDQAVFTGNTVNLQAAAAAMTPAMTELKDLQKKIAALGNALKEATSILSGIDKVVSELGALGL
jgi:high-affinity Fe2+/Pb2+ permease